MLCSLKAPINANVLQVAVVLLIQRSCDLNKIDGSTSASVYFACRNVKRSRFKGEKRILQHFS